MKKLIGGVVVLGVVAAAVVWGLSLRAERQHAQELAAARTLAESSGFVVAPFRVSDDSGTELRLPLKDLSGRVDIQVAALPCSQLEPEAVFLRLELDMASLPPVEARDGIQLWWLRYDAGSASIIHIPARNATFVQGAEAASLLHLLSQEGAHSVSIVGDDGASMKAQLQLEGDVRGALSLLPPECAARYAAQLVTQS